MSSRRGRTRTVHQLVLAAVLTALALGLSLIDTALSSVLGAIPGAKLGLANLVSLYAIYYMGLPWALAICTVRCLLGAVFAGQAMMFLFSISGALGSILVMYALKRHVSIVKVSTAGGVAHNMMQLAAAGILTATSGLLYYMPVLICLGTVSGFCLGIAAALVFRRLPATLKRTTAA